MPFDPIGYVTTKPVDELDRLLRRWADELRSGRWEQCKFELHDAHGRHCANGVGFRAIGYREFLKAYELAPTLINSARIANDMGRPFSAIAGLIDAYADQRLAALP